MFVPKDLGIFPYSNFHRQLVVQSHCASALQHRRAGVSLIFDADFQVRLLFKFSTFMFSLSQQDQLDVIQLIPSAVILIVYFIGKLQRKQKQQALFAQLKNFTFFRFNAKYEFTLIILSIGMFVFLAVFPEYANNNIANWFEENVKDLSNTFIIGFIFKVVGFFFLVNMIMKRLIQ